MFIRVAECAAASDRKTSVFLYCSHLKVAKTETKLYSSIEDNHLAATSSFYPVAAVHALKGPCWFMLANALKEIVLGDSRAILNAKQHKSK